MTQLRNAVKPYYEDDGATIYHGDCREILPMLDLGSIDLLLIDPPYGQDFQSNNRAVKLDKIVGDDGSLDLPPILSAACRLLRRNRHAYIFGPSVDLSSTPLTAAVELIWDKQLVGLGNLELPWSLGHEPITFTVYEPSRANREKGYGRLSARIRQGSVIRCERITGQATGRHPNEKPVLLLRQLIESSSLINETVLDCFMGSGSTLVAAVTEGRRAVGIEIEERYCEMAVRRLAVEVPRVGTPSDRSVTPRKGTDQEALFDVE